MSKKFICVFTDEAKTLLLQNGFRLLKEDVHNKMYVFENNEKRSERMSFALDQVSYILTDTLTF